MNHASHHTKKIISAAAVCALGLVAGVTIATPRAPLAPEPDPDPAWAAVRVPSAELPREELIVSQPIYIVVDRKAGAPMATGELPVEVIRFAQPTRVQVYRTPQDAVASAEPHRPHDDAQDDPQD